jgi:hypothetical protein
MLVYKNLKILLPQNNYLRERVLIIDKMGIPRSVKRELRGFHEILMEDYDPDNLPPFRETLQWGFDCHSVSSYMGCQVPGAKRVVFIEADQGGGDIRAKRLLPVKYPKADWQYHMSAAYKNRLLDPILKKPTPIERGARQIFGREVDYYFMDLEHNLTWNSTGELLNKIISGEIKPGDLFVPSDQTSDL